MPHTVSPGWYQDPAEPDGERWWDSVAWTEHRRPKPAAVPATSAWAPPAVPASPETRATSAPRRERFAGSPATFEQAIADGFAGYVTFTGKSSRSAFWWWQLFAALTALAAFLVDLLLSGGVLSNLVGLGLFLPGLTVLIRRLRDAGYLWPWVFLLLVPFAGIVVIVFCCERGRPPQA